MKHERMFQVISGDGANAIRSKEFVFVEQVNQYPLELFLVANRQEPAVGVADKLAVGRAICSTTSGCRFRNNSTNSAIRGCRATTPGSKTVAAHSGSKPTIERTFSRMASPFGKRRTS